MNRKWFRDWLERVLWTAAQVGAASITVAGLQEAGVAVPDWAVGPLTVSLAMLKGYLAKRVGDPDSAGTADLRQA